MDIITVTARTAGEAVTKTLIELEAISDKLGYGVVDKGNTGFLGIGTRPAIIRTKKKKSTEDKVMDSLSQIFEAMNIQVNTTATYNQEEQKLSLNLEGGDVRVLIGKRGQTLDSLRYLVSLVVNKGTEEYLRAKLSTKNYREGRRGTPETLVKSIAYKVKRTKKPVSLESTNPYERRTIHTALQNDEYVTTRSEGKEPFHHMVIALEEEATSGGRKGRYGRNKGRRYEHSNRSGGYRNNRRTNRNNVSQTNSDTLAGTAAGEEE